MLYALSYGGIVPIYRDFSSAATRQEYQSCEICGKPETGTASGCLGRVSEGAQQRDPVLVARGDVDG